MKNASKHADELKSLCKKLVKEHKPPEKQLQEPLPALVHAILGFDTTDARIDEAMAVINKEFVDLNELRVATELELQEMLGKYPQIEKRVGMMIQDLNHIFEKEHTLNLNRLKDVGKKEIRQFLRDMPDMNPFVEGYTMLFGFDSSAFPIDEDMLAYFKDQEIVEEDASLEDVQKFIESNLKAEELYEFFMASRLAAQQKKKKAKA